MATRLTDRAPALYFYGVSRGSARRLSSRLAGLRGIDVIGEIECCACSGLTCWYSRVDRGEYGERIERNMENLEWLANASVHHQRVVGTISEVADILPARFGTVFLGERSMAAHVAERRASLVRALERIEGAAEWGVKVFAELPAPAAPAPATSGADYLRKKREQLRQRARPPAPVEIEEMSAALEKAAVASVTVRGKAPQPGLVWQASFLVKRRRDKAFHGVLRKFAPRMTQARIETSGPWPAYSFAGSPEEAQPAERKPARSARNPRSAVARRTKREGSKEKTRASLHPSAPKPGAPGAPGRPRPLR